MNLLPWFLKIPGHEQNVRVPSAPTAAPREREQDDTQDNSPWIMTWGSFGGNSNFDMSFQTERFELSEGSFKAPKPKGPQGGSVTVISNETTRTDPDWWFLPANQPSDAEIIEMGSKYLLMRSPILTVPFWLIQGAERLLPEEEDVYY